MSQSLLRNGLIIEIAEAAGVRFRRRDKKCPTRCPFHQDKNASAFLDPETNCFYCSVCTPGGGLSAKQFAERLGVQWPPMGAFEQAPPPSRRLHEVEVQPSFTPIDAQRVWNLAQDRARDDAFAEADAAVYSYLRSRGLGESWEHGLFGLLSSDMSLPDSVRRWPVTGYRLVAPLYDSHGEIACIQARSILPSAEPKTLFPSGSKVGGTLFASPSGVEILRGSWSGEKRVLLGEGMTDFLALSTVSPVPVLSAPGTNMAASGIGPWIDGYQVLLALDCDEAGEGVVTATAKEAYERGARGVLRVSWHSGCKDACAVVERVGLEGLLRFLTKIIAEVPDARSAA